MSVLAKKEGSVKSISTSPLHFLITTIGGRYLAFDTEMIQGVPTNEEVNPFHDPVVQGRVYGLVDLTLRLNLSNESLGDGTRIVLLAHGSARGSVRVDKIHGILEIQRSQVLPFPALFRGPEQRWYLGMIPFDGSVALILNIAWVLEAQSHRITLRPERQDTEPTVAVQGGAESKNLGC